ncbi:MAG TPA: serine hydrolase domain-containing protein [Chloroflexota bacterium]|jgi:CubicO group peptidase (beta-lactamase class C family)
MSGLSKARLGRLREALARHVEHGNVPGLVAVVHRRGETHVEALGARGVGMGPVGRDTIFRIASMSKPVAAVAAMILVEECRLRLDDPVDELLPELANRRVLTRPDASLDDTVPANRPITLRDLLTFTFGYGMFFGPPDQYPIVRASLEQLGSGMPCPGTTPPPDEWIRRLGTLPLMYQPGELWQYNTGSYVLSVLVGRAAGQAFDAFLRERIFGPLGMRESAFYVPAEKLDRFTACHSIDFETGAEQVYDAAEGGQWAQPPAFPSGADGLVSTVDDYLAFGRMMLNGGRLGDVRILSRPSVELITTDHLTPAQKTGGLDPRFFQTHGWGFGLAVRTARDDLEAVGAYGWDGGLGTVWRNDPREELVAVLLTNRAWTSPTPPSVARDFLTSAYQAIED